MAMVNALLASVSYVMSPGGASGYSLMALSCPISVSQDFWSENTYCIAVTNTVTTSPMHVEVRATWTDLNGVSQTTAIPTAKVSNFQGFGGSAIALQTLTLLLSGQNAVIPIDYVIGSAVQVWLLAASTTATNVGPSGLITLWRAR